MNGFVIEQRKTSEIAQRYNFKYPIGCLISSFQALQNIGKCGSDSMTDGSHEQSWREEQIEQVTILTDAISLSAWTVKRYLRQCINHASRSTQLETITWNSAIIAITIERDYLLSSKSTTSGANGYCYYNHDEPKMFPETSITIGANSALS